MNDVVSAARQSVETGLEKIPDDPIADRGTLCTLARKLDEGMATWETRMVQLETEERNRLNPPREPVKKTKEETKGKKKPST